MTVQDTISKLLNDPLIQKNAWRMEFVIGLQVWLEQGRSLSEKQLDKLIELDDYVDRVHVIRINAHQNVAKTQQSPI